LTQGIDYSERTGPYKGQGQDFVSCSAQKVDCGNDRTTMMSAIREGKIAMVAEDSAAEETAYGKLYSVHHWISPKERADAIAERVTEIRDKMSFTAEGCGNHAEYDAIPATVSGTELPFAYEYCGQASDVIVVGGEDIACRVEVHMSLLWSLWWSLFSGPVQDKSGSMIVATMKRSHPEEEVIWEGKVARRITWAKKGVSRREEQNKLQEESVVCSGGALLSASSAHL
jgi:hypothetical protein